MNADATGRVQGSTSLRGGSIDRVATHAPRFGGDWRTRGHAGWWAFALHRTSGVLLTLFLPFHFLALGQALTGESALQGFLAWTDRPLVRASEIVLVFLLAVHLAGGVRLLLVEWRGWRAAAQPTLIAGVFGFALIAALLFALNLL